MTPSQRAEAAAEALAERLRAEREQRVLRPARPSAAAGLPPLSPRQQAEELAADRLASALLRERQLMHTAPIGHLGAVCTDAAATSSGHIETSALDDMAVRRAEGVASRLRREQRQREAAAEKLVTGLRVARHLREASAAAALDDAETAQRQLAKVTARARQAGRHRQRAREAQAEQQALQLSRDRMWTFEPANQARAPELSRPEAADKQQRQREEQAEQLAKAVLDGRLERTKLQVREHKLNDTCINGLVSSSTHAFKELSTRSSRG